MNMAELQQLSHDSFYNMQNYSQITIDFIEQLEEALSAQYFGEQEREDVLGSLSYNISTVVEVINPILKTDKEALSNLINIIEKELCIGN